MELFPRSTRGSRTWPRKIEYAMLAYMTLANTQTILVHLTWKFHWLTRLEERNIFRGFSKLLEHFYFYILHFIYVRRTWWRRDVLFCKFSSSYSNTFLFLGQKTDWLTDWSLEGRGHVANHSWDTIIAAGKLHKEVWVLLQIWVSSRVREQQFCVSRVTKQIFTFSRFMKVEVVQNAKNSPR